MKYIFKFILNKNPDLLSAIMLVVGVSSILSLIYRDVFDHDSYVLMSDVEKSFSEYSLTMAPFTLPQRIHYWITYHFLGGKISDYLVGTTTSIAVALMFIWHTSKKYFNEYPYLPFITTAIMSFNSHVIYLAYYSMISYAMSFLVSVLLIQTYLSFVEKDLLNISWKWIPVFIIPAALFTNLTITIPVLTGGIAAYVITAGNIHNVFDVKRMRNFLFFCWPLAFFPLSYFVIYSIQPLTNMGRDKRPDMDPFFFFQDIYGEGFINAFSFLLLRSKDFYVELLQPIGVLTTLFIILTSIIFKFILKNRLEHSSSFISMNGKLNNATNFTILYVILTTVLMALGGLIKIYPYGTARYGSFLIFPLVLLLGISIHSIVDNFFLCIRIERLKRLILAIVGTVIIIHLSHEKLNQYFVFKKGTAEMHQLVESANLDSVDLVLMAAYYRPVFMRLRPDIYNSIKTRQLGWGSSWGKPFKGEIELPIRAILQTETTNRVLVIASSMEQFKNSYPAYSEMLFDHYELKREELAVNMQSIWLGYFIKKE